MLRIGFKQITFQTHRGGASAFMVFEILVKLSKASTEILFTFLIFERKYINYFEFTNCSPALII